MSVRRVVGPSLLVASLLLACGKVVGVLSVGDKCTASSECTSPLLCAFERCRTTCTSSGDCNGARCVAGEGGGNVCQLDDEKLVQGVECTQNASCAGRQECASDQRCRDLCQTNQDCVTGFQCVTGLCAKPEELVDGRIPVVGDAGAVGLACILSRDCPPDLVCFSGLCKEECAKDKDCPVGNICRPVRADGPLHCVKP